MHFGRLAPLQRTRRYVIAAACGAIVLSTLGIIPPGTSRPASAAVASMVTNLDAAADNGQAWLTWSRPASDGGDAITDYVVEYKTSASGVWNTFADGTSTVTAANVTGLANGTPYDFRVSAVNASGTWKSLPACITDTANNTISCTTTGFSVFTVFASRPKASAIVSELPAAPTTTQTTTKVADTSAITTPPAIDMTSEESVESTETTVAPSGNTTVASTSDQRSNYGWLVIALLCFVGMGAFLVVTRRRHDE
jgi:hypothetical protein